MKSGCAPTSKAGCRWTRSLSYDLLATIFRPSAPLHDGAVIVQKDRIAAAACFLPLSMNPVLSTQLGTRHRAGIGMTEETDAIAVIVSEETGAISLAVGGTIERDLTVEQLRERIGELLRRYVPPSTLPTPIDEWRRGTRRSRATMLRGCPRRARPIRGSRREASASMKDFFRRHVLHNLGIKLLSLVLAVGCGWPWRAIRWPKLPSSVPIEFRNMPENLEISTESIPRAEIRVRGPQRIMRRLQPADIYAEIDLGGMKPGERTFDLTAQQIHKPSELEVVQVVPNQFHLTFDTRLTRQVPVRPRVFGNFAARLPDRTHRRRTPPTITISGPGSGWRRWKPRLPIRWTPAAPWIARHSYGMLTFLIPWCK